MHASGTADITIASVWSIVSGDRLLKFNPKKFKLVLVDEAHHIVAASFMKTLGHFGLLKADLSDSSPALVGVSATMSRFDGLRLSDAIDHIVYHKDYVDMIGREWLSDVLFTTVKSTANVSRVKKASTGDCDFQIGDLSRAVNTEEINEITVRAWMDRAAGRKSTLVFCVDLAHVSDLTAAFRRNGIDARFVTGDTHKRIRSDRLDGFKSGEFPVLLNCGVFTEGTDIPNIDCVLLARPTRSRNLLIQMMGRGMRLHHDKNNCHVIDMVCSLEAGVISTPTLFGLDPDTLVKEASIEEMKSSQERKEREEIREQRAEVKNPSLPKQGSSRTLTFTDYESVYDLIDDTSGERHIRGISALAWVLVGPNRYILSSQDGSHLSIEGKSSGEESVWTVTFTQKLSAEAMEASSAKSPYMRPRQIASSTTFSDAVHAADTFASSRMPWRVVHAGQAWRKYPASDAQLAVLNKTRGMEDQLTTSMVTKGKANDMITKLRFGARGWFSNLEARKKREGRVQEKARQVGDPQQREQVKIGPVRRQLLKISQFFDS